MSKIESEAQRRSRNGRDKGKERKGRERGNGN